MTSELDKRLHAYREDLADKTLQGKVEATRFVEGKPAVVKTPFADLLRQPKQGSVLDTQVLHGHEVMVFERANGWAWVQRIADGYVGYLREDMIEPVSNPATAPRTFLYSEPDLQRPRTGYRSMGSKLIVTDKATTRGTDYLILESSEAVIAKHVMKIGEWQSDPVTVAESLLHTPYLWGGNSGFGIDCSGLISLSNTLCGNSVLRDSDMLGATYGKELETDFTNLQRGDVVFWKGHCGMMLDNKNLLHANGNTMNVAIENLANAITRIGYLYGQPTSARRP